MDGHLIYDRCDMADQWRNKGFPYMEHWELGIHIRNKIGFFTCHVQKYIPNGLENEIWLVELHNL